MMNKKIKKILLKKNKSKIVSLTAYSKSITKILDRHVDIVLVGDSMANVLYGHKNTHKIKIVDSKYRKYCQVFLWLETATIIIFFQISKSK